MKIICPYCENVNEVAKGAVHVSCDKCGQSFTIEDGKRKTVAKYKELQNLGYNFLYQTYKFELAKNCYEECLLIKENDLSSIIGVCLSNIALSTFDETHFNFVIPYIEKHDIVLNVENTNIFLHFINDCLKYVEAYFKGFDSRLIKDGTVINKKYLQDYIKSTKDILDLFAFFKDSFELMDQKELESYNEDFPTFNERLEFILKDANERLNKVYNVNHFGDIKYENGEFTIINSNKKDLDIDEINDLHIIRENNEGKLYAKIFIPLVAVFGLLTLILFIVFGSLKNVNYIYGACGSLGLTLILYTTYQILLKRSYRK